MGRAHRTDVGQRLSVDVRLPDSLCLISISTRFDGLGQSGEFGDGERLSSTGRIDAGDGECLGGRNGLQCRVQGLATLTERRIDQTKYEFPLCAAVGRAVRGSRGGRVIGLIPVNLTSAESTLGAGQNTLRPMVPTRSAVPYQASFTLGVPVLWNRAWRRVCRPPLFAPSPRTSRGCRNAPTA